MDCMTFDPGFWAWLCLIFGAISDSVLLFALGVLLAFL